MKTFPTLLVHFLFFFVANTIQGQPALNSASQCGIDSADIVPESHQYGFSLQPNPVVDDQYDHDEIPSRGGKAELGLALSGGGIRSGSFTIGVLKALHEKGILGKVDVISSVSGGGYASLWLLTHYQRNTNISYGDRAFGNTIWLRNTCELQSLGNFFTNRRAIGTTTKDKLRTFREYENAILRTFGNGMKYDVKMHSLANDVIDQKTPYFILNTSIVSKGLSQADKIFEITPRHMGNPKLGYFKWKKNDNESLRLSESVTVAAAGKKKIRREVQNFSPEKFPDRQIILEDGGRTENLGAYSLLRRDIPRVIIVDAEHDFDYRFGAYLVLKKMLRKIGRTLEVKAIDEFIKLKKNKNGFTSPAISRGTVTTKDSNGQDVIQTEVFYIKMGRPETILPARTVECKEKYNCETQIEKNNVSEDCEAYQKGKRAFKVLDKLTKNKCEGKKYLCDLAENSPLTKEMYVYRARRYSRYINCGFKFWKMGFRISDEYDFRYRFPQITTYDQDFKRDQLEAFVGLGYLQALELDTATL